MQRYFALIITLCFLTVWSGDLAAQFGVSFRQHHWKADNWEAIIAENDSAHLAQKHIRFGAHYWFRLKNQRIEFLPEIAYLLPIDRRISALEGQMEGLSAQILIDIYIFDLKGDCNCPTFSKQGDAFQKGFFLEIAPGLQWSNLKLLTRNDDQSSGIRMKTRDVSFRLAAGAGLDLGLSDLFTVTPWVQGVWMPSADWDGLSEALYVDGDSLDETSQVLSIGFGVRFLFRPDYKRGRF